MPTARGMASRRCPVTFLQMPDLWQGSCVERLVPFRSHDPAQRRHSPAQEPPFEVVPPQFLLAVLSFNSFGRLLCLLQDRLLIPGQRFLPAFNSLQPDLVPVPPNLVPEFVIGPQDVFIVSSQQEWPLLSGVLLIGHPLHLVAIFCVPDPVAIWANLTRLNRIPRLGACALAPYARPVPSRKLAVQFLNDRHEVRVEAGNLNTGFSQTQLTATAYYFVWIQNSDKDFSDTSLDYPVGTRDLGVISRSAWFQRNKEGPACKRLIGELIFEERKFCVLSRGKFPAKRFPKYNPSRAITAPTFGDILPGSLLHFRARSIALSMRSLSLNLADDGRERAALLIHRTLRAKPSENPPGHRARFAQRCITPIRRFHPLASRFAREIVQPQRIPPSPAAACPPLTRRGVPTQRLRLNQRTPLMLVHWGLAT